MPRIYLTGSSLGRGYMTGSGVISNPPRTILQLKDNATGSYPTASRIGDPGRTGRYAINFNDTKSIVFNRNVTTSYPTNLQLADAAYISQSVATPNTNATIEATGIVRKGVADANIMFTPGEDLKPFVDDSLYASTKSAFTDPFYLTGSTVADVGLGFTAPLRSKTKIEIDLNPIASDVFGFISGSAPAAEKSAEDLSEDPNVWPMVYYNFSDRKYQRIGSGIPSATRYGSGQTNSTVSMLTKSGTVGFSRGTELMSEGLRAQCRPISSFGFPSDTRYHATSSHLYPMSGVLDKPFLVEKFVYEFKAAYFVGTDVSTRDAMFRPAGNAIVEDRNTIGRASIMSFFILNQRNPMSTNYPTYPTQNLNHVVGGGSATSVSSVSFPILIPSSTQLGRGGPYTNVNTYRDLVTYGQATIFRYGATSDSFMSGAISTGGLGREVNINANAATVPMTASFVMSGTVKTTPAFTSGPVYRISKYEDNKSDRLTISTNYLGVRPGFGTFGNRGLTSNTPGAAISGSMLDFGISGSSQGTSDSYSITTFEDYDIASPYLLKPEDNLIFGWQVPMPIGWKRAADSGTGPNMQVLPGKGKLTLYGSLITEAHEHHDGLNQPLTSDAVHEFIGFHGPPLDQFDTEPRQQFSGSMFSNVVTGALAGTAGNERGIKGQRSDSAWLAGNPTKVPNDDLGITAHQAVTKNLYPHRSPSFSRAIIYEESNGRFYDSCTPNAFDIYNIDGKSYDIGSGFGYVLALGGREVLYNGSLWGNSRWPRMFPFEGRFKGVSRNISSVFPEKPSTNIISGKVKTLGFGSITLPKSPLGASNDGMQIALPYGNTMYGRQNIEKTSKEALTIIKNTLWGFGSNSVSGTVGYFHCTAISTYSAPKQPEGFKYGLYHANFKNVFCHFSANNYGQFRDMLEQRLDTRFYSETSGRSTISSSPVQARFVSSDGTSESPSKTSCSNLSQFVTSSLPYFDGIARNRGPVVSADLGLSIVSI